MQLQFRTGNAFYPMRYNVLTTSQEAAVFVREYGTPTGKFNFAIHTKSGAKLTRIAYLNPTQITYVIRSPFPVVIQDGDPACLMRIFIEVQ